ncbi:MAG: dethiobiotin synthase [Bacteroidota bacterium]
MKRYFVTAIGTDSGKTFFSAILTEALKADYWKPVQSGEPADSKTVASLISNEESSILKERYFLKTPASPHASAAIDGVEIKAQDFTLPEGNRNLVVEGAGGLLVPLNQEETIADLIKVLGIPVILVSNLYLGNINHTLLSAHYLQSAGIAVAGIVFNGPANPASEEVIEKMTGYPVLLRIAQEELVDKEVVKRYAAQLIDQL